MCEDMIDLAQDAPQGITVQLHFAGSCHREGGPADWGAMLLSPTGMRRGWPASVCQCNHWSEMSLEGCS